jgi:hypothetical protein
LRLNKEDEEKNMTMESIYIYRVIFKTALTFCKYNVYVK